MMFKKKAKRWLLIIGVIILLVVILSFWLRSRSQAVSYSTTPVQIGPLLQTVSETGTLKPVKELALNFLSSGRVQSIKVKVGDKVAAGAELAALDNSALQVRRSEAEAGLKIADASLSKILAGASQETISISRSTLSQAQTSANSARIDLDRTKASVDESIRQAAKTLSDLESKDPGTLTPSEQTVSSAETALSNAKQTGEKNVSNAYDSAILTINDKILSAKIALDKINTILEDDDAATVLGVKNISLLWQTKNERQVALSMVAPAEAAAALAKTNGSETSVEDAAVKVKALLLQTDRALDYAYAMLEASITYVSFTQTDLDNYKTIISTQSTTINTASTAIEAATQAFHNAILNKNTSIASAEENLRQAQSSLTTAILAARNSLSSLNLSGAQQISAAQARLDSAQKSVALALAQLNSTIAPARAQDIALAQAQVSQAAANLAGIEQQLKDAVLTAPVEGVVTAVNYEVGEQFSLAGKPMIVILVNNSFNVEVDIAESNISKVKVGDPVDITLDAFPDDFVLKGLVSFIEPAQTLVQDVVYYKVKVDFANLSETMNQIAARNLDLKAGMTANIIITTDSRTQVMQVPARAIIEKDGKKIIRLLKGKDMSEVEVSTGLRGDEGMIEVTSGLMADDLVVTFVKNGK